jgi:multidrug efflux system membrane fusion protein
MASAALKPSRIIAVAIVGGAALWIASGVFGSNDAPTGDPEPRAAAAVPVQKVAVKAVRPEEHDRTIVVSCVTEADHRAIAAARGDGILVDLLVSQGDTVRAGDTVAKISDEGREAAVKQAEALLAQRKAEYDAIKKLIDQGTSPRNTLPALEAALASADATLAAARAEEDKLEIKSPIDGVVDSMPLQVGQAVRSGTEVAEIIDPDPMLAVGAVSEFRRGSIRIGQDVSVRFVEGEPIDGKIHFVGLSAEAATRTYKVEAQIDNSNAAIADGLTCEMTIVLAPIEAVAVPRSSLVFSDEGILGVMAVDDASKARFVAVDVVEDLQASVWVTGIDDPSNLIVVGQDFVKDGDLVEAIPTAGAAESEPQA